MGSSRREREAERKAERTVGERHNEGFNGGAGRLIVDVGGDGGEGRGGEEGEGEVSDDQKGARLNDCSAVQV
jgi:hypothetical protein